MLLIDNKINAFTLIELIIAILISVLLLGGIFYFMSDTILAISRASAHSKFLKDFYSFTTIFDTGSFEILHDYPKQTGFDVGILTTLDRNSGVIVGIVNQDTGKLSPQGMSNVYHNSVLGYRSVSQSELSDITTNPNLVYDYEFFKDKLFYNFNLRDFQLEMFNSGDLVEMNLSIFPDYKPDLNGQVWQGVPQDSIFYYSLTF